MGKGCTMTWKVVVGGGGERTSMMVAVYLSGRAREVQSGSSHRALSLKSENDRLQYSVWCPHTLTQCAILCFKRCICYALLGTVDA